MRVCDELRQARKLVNLHSKIYKRENQSEYCQLDKLADVPNQFGATKYLHPSTLMVLVSQFLEKDLPLQPLPYPKF